MGISDLLVGDMGGTSFDTALVRGLEPMLTPHVEVAGMPTGVTMLDILSVGWGAAASPASTTAACARRPAERGLDARPRLLWPWRHGAHGHGCRRRRPT